MITPFLSVKPATILDANIIAHNVLENDYPNWLIGDTTINLGTRRLVIGTNVHLVYESLVNANIGFNPLSEPQVPPKWVLVGKTNKYRMFDEFVTSQTQNAESITFTVKNLGMVTTLGFLNADFSTINVVGTDDNAGVFYNSTLSGTSEAGIVDEYEWCWGAVQKIKDVAFTDIPPYLNASFNITISAPGYTAICGAFIPGQSRAYGGINFGAVTGIVDYSTKQIDQWGNYFFKQGAYAKTLSCDMLIDNNQIDAVQYDLAELRAVPALYVGSNLYGSTIIYGKYDSFKNVIAYPLQSLMSMELQGLI